MSGYPHHFSDEEEEEEEYEHCFCPEHASFVQSRFHEVLLDFFSGHNFDVHSDHANGNCEHFYEKRFYKAFNRERFGMDSLNF